jgi:hypothetical protein
MKILLRIALIFLLPGSSLACSMAMSPEFDAAPDRGAQPALSRVEVEKVTFVPWINHEGDCDGVGFISIRLAEFSARKAKRHGFLIRVVSGVNDEELFPAYPLTAIRIDGGSLSINWAWTGITADPDGHVRWRLELVPVSRSGARGTPIPLCAASDGSCPADDGRAPD